MQGELEWAGRIDIGEGVSERARIDVTSKGNGFLKMCGQKFGVYDDHDDGAIFDPYFARVTFFDIDNDGYRDLLICGLLQTTEGPDAGRAAPFLRAYRYDIKERRFAAWSSEKR